MGNQRDEEFMREALREATKAAAKGEVPIGACVVADGEIVSRAHNLRETVPDPTAHAEILALREAALAKGAWRLTGATLYVTVEPCLMCAGAILLARLDRVVFGAADPKAGAMGSLYCIHDDDRFNHTVEVAGGILAEECAAVLRDFFSDKR